MTWTSERIVRGPAVAAASVPWWRSLRLRTAVVMTVLATTLVVGAGAVFARTAIDDATTQLREQAVTQLKEAIATHSFGGTLPPRATEDPAVLPPPLRSDVASGRAVTFDDGRWMWAARSQSSGLIATRIDNAPLRAQWANLQRTFVLAALLAAAIAAVGSWIAAGRLTARLRRTSRAVDDTVAGREAAGIDGDDEVGVLARGLADTAAALARSLDHERAISAEVAHDMRTPVTALVGAAELLPDGPDADRVRRIADRLRQLLDDVLELSRAAHTASDVRTRPADLATTVQHVVAGRATVTVRSSDTVLLDEDHLDRALTNLLANADRHGAGPVTVEVDGASVTVRDHGPGFPEDVLRDGPRRFGALGTHGGSGIGLAITVQHVRAMAAVLRLRNGPGAEARITFADAGPARASLPARASSPASSPADRAE